MSKRWWIFSRHNHRQTSACMFLAGRLIIKNAPIGGAGWMRQENKRVLVNEWIPLDVSSSHLFTKSCSDVKHHLPCLWLASLPNQTSDKLILCTLEELGRFHDPYIWSSIPHLLWTLARILPHYSFTVSQLWVSPTSFQVCNKFQIFGKRSIPIESLFKCHVLDT